MVLRIQNCIGSADNIIASTVARPAFKHRDNYFRVDEVYFDEKPFIVFEYGTLDDVMRNTMENILPFPYDLYHYQ